MATPKLDLTKLTPEERRMFEGLAAKAGANVSSLSDREYRIKCLAMRPEFERMATEQGVTLDHISASRGTWYRHPETGQTYSKGKTPDWLPENEEKRKAFEDKITEEEIKAAFEKLFTATGTDKAKKFRVS